MQVIIDYNNKIIYAPDGIKLKKLLSLFKLKNFTLNILVDSSSNSGEHGDTSMIEVAETNYPIGFKK